MLLDVISLRVRLGLVLVLAASLPLILAVAAISSAAETSAMDYALADQRLAAANIARAVTQFDAAYRGAITSIASRAGFAVLSPEQQRTALQGLMLTDVFGFSIYDATGHAVVRSDDHPLQDLPPTFVTALRAASGASVSPDRVPGTDDPELVFAAPFRAANGQIAGFVAAEIASSQIGVGLKQLGDVQREGSVIKLVDADGRALVHPNLAVMSAAADLSQEVPIAAARAGSDSGSVQFRTPSASYVAGYARVPTLGWIATVEYPTADVLAGVQAGRQFALVVLLLASIISAAIGAIVADRFVRPLTTLGRAAESLAENDTSTELPHSGFPEIEHLAAIFGRMRDRLAARNAQRERALGVATDAVNVRDAFLSVAAHELKTPVTAIRGHAQVLLRRFERGYELPLDDVRRSLRRVDTQAYKLQRLTDALLDVARLQSGRLALEQRETDLREVIAETVAASPHRDRIDVRLPASPQMVLVDQLRLEQVLANLLDNATKFSPGNTLVELSLEPTDSSEARIAVRDRGLGVPPEHRDRIFERFYQAHNDSHRSGLGLGLYISKQIVDLHHGRIRAEFPSSGGTRFVIDLPLEHAA